MRTWITKNAATIGAVTGAATLFTTITGSLLYLLVTQPMNHRFDLVDQRFVAMNHRFDLVDQRFVAMEQRFDVVEQRFLAKEQHIEQGFNSVNQRIDDLEKLMGQGFAHAREAREQDFAHLSQRIEDLAENISQLHKLTTAIGERVSRTERHIDAIERHLQIPGTPSP